MYRVSTAIALGIALSSLGATAGAVDLRDWGRKYPASERFVVLAQFSNDAVLDKETQLVWQRTPSANTASRQFSAAGLCSSIRTGGRLGWRLPSLHEMASLADPSVPLNALALPAGHPFQAVPKGVYWTATQIRGLSTHGYAVRLELGGIVLTLANVEPAYYWCVRGAGPISEY